MLAKQGAINDWHFAHAVDMNCSSAGETALHLAVKQSILDGNRIGVPALEVDATATVDGYTRYASRVINATIVPYSSPRTEVRIADVIADAVVQSHGQELIVEVAVTHKVDDEKLGKLRKLRRAALELQAWTLPRTAGWDELREFLAGATDRRAWLFNGREDIERRNAYREALRLARAASQSATRSPIITTPAKPLALHVDGIVVEKFKCLWTAFKEEPLWSVTLDDKAAGWVMNWYARDVPAGKEPEYFDELVDWIMNKTKSVILTR
ncbi:hypothetical protein [Caballeronia grimmiae]